MMFNVFHVFVLIYIFFFCNCHIFWCFFLVASVCFLQCQPLVGLRYTEKHQALMPMRVGEWKAYVLDGKWDPKIWDLAYAACKPIAKAYHKMHAQ